MNRYAVDSILAEGGQGRVYRAEDKLTGQRCVLKTGDSIRNEAFLAIELNHPYIARPFDYSKDAEIGAFAAYPEYLEPSLLKWIKTHPSNEELRRVALQIAEFMAFLHHRGWLYHDFKPQHFLVGEQAIRVLDLGLAARIQDASSTFSGTFPYIAPERLTGRRCDARSDIFAFGMLMLHILTPEENWDFEPSLGILQDLQKRSRKLSGFWRDLISETTALEPSQRIETAAELWKRLLPSSARGTFLFFPPPPYFDIPQITHNGKVLALQSASPLNLLEAESRICLGAWKSETNICSFDLRSLSVEKMLEGLCLIASGQTSKPTDVLSAIQILQNLNPASDIIVVLRIPPSIQPSQRALLSYALTSLTAANRLHFLLLSSRAIVDVPEDYVERIDLPIINRQTLERMLPSIIPSDGEAKEKAEKIRADNPSVPEQILTGLRRDLPAESFSLWPAVAREIFLPPPLEKLTVSEMRTLGCFAIAGGALPKKWLLAALKLNQTQGEDLLGRLQAKGYLQQESDRFALTLSHTLVIQRLRKDRMRQLAEALLANFTPDQDLEIGFRIARIARSRRAAALLALRIARRYEHQNRNDQAKQWLWLAFSSGAHLTKTQLIGLARFYIRKADPKKAKALLNHVIRRFGYSYKIADLFLDLDQRVNDLSGAATRAARTSGHAKKKKHPVASKYFQARQGGFLILQHHLDEGDTVLNSLVKEQNPSIRGICNHFLGLSAFFRGKYDVALELTKKAAHLQHKYRGTSFMNLGAVLLRLGKFDECERYLNNAIQLYSKQNDTALLPYAYNNKGVLLKQYGKMKEARESYFSALLWSKANKNQHLSMLILINVATTYEIEGRTRKAINYHTKALKLASRSGNKVQQATALTYAARQYAIEGKFSKAIGYLKRAIKLREELKLVADLASSYEALGVTYFLSNHPRDAENYFLKAEKLFREAGASNDENRCKIYRSFLKIEHGLYKDKPEAPETLDTTSESFENGLYQLSVASWFIKCGNLNAPECRDSLHSAELVFRNLPSLYWLGKLQKLKSEYFSKTDHLEKANISLDSAYNIFARLGARKEILSLTKGNVQIKSATDLLNRMAERLPYRVLMMVKEVLAEQNPDQMISKILSASLEFTDMERSVLILAEDPPRIFKSATLDDSVVNEIYEISQSALDEAADSKRPYVRLNAVSDPYLSGKPSILASRIMSIVCLPLRAGERMIGVLYLDSREGIETLAATETVLLEIFASIISLALNNSLVLERSLAENENLRNSMGLINFPEIIGKSETIMKVLKNVQQLLQTDLPVLITGETGTGKELIARILHFSGKRKNGAFLAVNCSALTKTLLESELFGHEKGSFTGAIQQKKGLFEQAKHGTLFLDEVAEMPTSMQAKLLRVLQEGEFRRVGGSETLQTDARVILATNRNLLEMVKEGDFREDLFYRIKGAQVYLPALRERPEDIPLLAAHFLKSAAQSARKSIAGFTPEALEVMRKHAWPGNVRQLKNEVERIVAFAQSEWVRPEELDAEIREQPQDVSPKGTLREREKQIILEALQENKWNIVHTARSLGLTRNGLYGKMKLHGITPKAELKR